MTRQAVHKIVAERPWQGDLCQFFTREQVARFCLRQVALPKNILSIKLLEPAAGHGAFLLPLIPKLVKACRDQKRSHEGLRLVVRAYEIDPAVAESLRIRCEKVLRRHGVRPRTAKRIVREWIRNEDFLDANIKTRFSHIVGNPPYIRWDAIPQELRDSYRERFKLFKQRADLYVAFIEHALRCLDANGQLAFLCPGTWTRNTYGGAVRSAFTSQGRLKAIIDLSDVDSFEKKADSYPHLFVFQKGSPGATEIFSVVKKRRLARSGKKVTRQFAPSSSPLLLSRAASVDSVVGRARENFPRLDDADCVVRVGSATGCNDVFLGEAGALSVEKDRLLPFVNARSIRNATVTWTGTKIVNVFDGEGKLVRLADYPRLKSYLEGHKQTLKVRAKASKSKFWWRSIDALHPDWYRSPKLLVVDVSSTPVVGLDEKGYCAGSGVYQIKSDDWPLPDLLVLLSAGVLGLFVGGFSSGATSGFHRFQKAQIGGVPIPRWRDLDPQWRSQFQIERRAGSATSILDAVARLYKCPRPLLEAHVARDWESLFVGSKA